LAPLYHSVTFLIFDLNQFDFIFKWEGVFDWFEPGTKTVDRRIYNSGLDIENVYVTKIRNSETILPPDAYYSQFGIQFDLRSFELIEQTQRLERQLISVEEDLLQIGSVCFIQLGFLHLFVKYYFVFGEINFN
jgi:hypothetical protein